MGLLTQGKQTRVTTSLVDQADEILACVLAYVMPLLLLLLSRPVGNPLDLLTHTHGAHPFFLPHGLLRFIQFHPTALADAALPKPPPEPRANSFLITEAVRGAGGILRNSAGERFMRAYDRRGELAPRDVVARSIDEQVKKSGEPCVWLDISHKPREEVLRHFPNIAAECLR